MKTIKVSNGFVQGQVKTILEKEVVEFLSIPYCKSPINELRFKKPEISAFTNGIINNLTFLTCPPQLPFQVNEESKEDEELWIPKEEQSDDCLYVNIWCPLRVLESKEFFSVFVWIYGGGFVSGSSSLPIYNGSVLAIQENIITVSFNYRVGMLGFLCLDEEINGNQGIWDQVAALQWIHENIRNFQGDSNNITIGGNSAGGCSVSLHLIIEKSWDYFNKCMIQSGVCLSDWSFLPKKEITKRSENTINKLLEKNNSPLRWNKSLVKEEKDTIKTILQNMDFREFLIDSDVVDGLLNFAWTPCVDGELIKESPEILFKEKRFKICPSIFLNVENESTYFILLEFPDIEIKTNQLVDFTYLNKCFKYFPFHPYLCSLSILDKIIEKYKLSSKELTIKDLDNILSHRHFVTDSVLLADYVSENCKEVYYLWFKTLQINKEWPSWVGIMHGDEIYFLFGHNLKKNGKIDEACKLYMENIGKFIKHGSFSTELPFYEMKNRQFILVEDNQWKAAKFSEDDLEKFKFWNEITKESK